MVRLGSITNRRKRGIRGVCSEEYSGRMEKDTYTCMNWETLGIAVKGG